MKLETAFDLAKEYEKLLAPACERIMLVGSTRREKEDVKDIEFLLIPKTEIATDMFGEPLPNVQQQIQPLVMLINDLKAAGKLAEPTIGRKADGQKYKKFAIPGCEYMDEKEMKKKEFHLELWITTPQKWGILSVIRTGPSEFSYAFVNSENHTGFHKASGKRIKGLLPHYYMYIEGETRIIVRSTRNEERPELEQVLDLPEEIDALKLLGFRQEDNYWIPPEKRHLYVREVK